MKKNIILSFVGGAILLGVVSCGKPSQNSPEVSQAPSTPKVDSTQPTSTTPATVSTANAGTGSVSGTIHFAGEVPNLQKINMAADPKCVANNTGDVLPEILVLGEGKTVANVLVKITKGHEAVEVTTPTTPVVIDQKGCQYFPHIIGVQKDQPVKILNSDGTLHNVHIQAQANGEHNEAMPAFRKELEKTFNVVEAPFGIKCDVHPWMKAYVEVFDHPFFMTTKPDGHYTISNLPAGEYELGFWHEKLGQRFVNVKVEAGQDVQRDLDFPAPEGSAKLEFVQLANWQ